jgi:hypothetical protein
MRGGGTRGGPHSAWTVARLQRIGNWGRADEGLGRRWEDVGLLALASLLNEPRSLGPRHYTPTAILALADSEALRREVHASGLRNPDASLLGALPAGDGILQPVDFKWSLERAELPQVSAATIERLLDADLPGVQEHLGAVRIAAGLPEGDLEYVDGFFFAPNHAENRAYLASAANARAEFPLGARDVLLWTVEPSTFFAPLDGWELGRWLAEMDRSGGLLETVEGAERYFRLGAGFAGALVRLQTPLFADEPATVDARGGLSRLRTTRRLYTSVDLAAYLERLMAGREALERELRDLESGLYPFRQFRVDLTARKLPAAVADGTGPGLRERYRVIRAAIRARLRQEGRKLVSEGQSEAGALGQLKTQVPQLAKLAHGIAQRVLAAGA